MKNNVSTEASKFGFNIVRSIGVLQFVQVFDCASCSLLQCVQMSFRNAVG